MWQQTTESQTAIIGLGGSELHCGSSFSGKGDPDASLFATRTFDRQRNNGLSVSCCDCCRPHPHEASSRNGARDSTQMSAELGSDRLDSTRFEATLFRLSNHRCINCYSNNHRHGTNERSDLLRGFFSLCRLAYVHGGAPNLSGRADERKRERLRPSSACRPWDARHSSGNYAKTGSSSQHH